MGGLSSISSTRSCKLVFHILTYSELRWMLQDERLKIPFQNRESLPKTLLLSVLFGDASIPSSPADHGTNGTLRKRYFK